MSNTVLSSLKLLPFLLILWTASLSQGLIVNGDSVWCYTGGEIRSIYSKLVELDECTELLSLAQEKDSIRTEQIRSLNAVIIDMERSSDMKDQIVQLNLAQRDRAYNEVKRVKRRSVGVVTLSVIVVVGTVFLSVR